jgi:hypothetical protein
MPVHHRAQSRQRGREFQRPVVLGAVSLRAPPVVVAVLTAARGVGADGLDVATGVGADPDVPPCGRYDKRPYPVQRQRIGDGPVGAQVAEAAPAAAPPDSVGAEVAVP